MIKELEEGWKEINEQIYNFREGVCSKKGPKSFLMKTKSMIERG